MDHKGSTYHERIEYTGPCKLYEQAEALEEGVSALSTGPETDMGTRLRDCYEASVQRTVIMRPRMTSKQGRLKQRN